MAHKKREDNPSSCLGQLKRDDDDDLAQMEDIRIVCIGVGVEVEVTDT